MLEAALSPFPSTAFVHVLGPRPMVSLAAFKGQNAALNEALGVELPRTPRRITAPNLIYLWSGPDSWLAIGPDALELGKKIAHLAAITDQSDGQSLFRISGPFARAILGKLVPIDLHESAFPPDGVALTRAAHIGIRLWREEDSFVLGCFRSFAGSLHLALTEAAAEFASRA
jgi:heterotetrameric sarcosine oxidase gamma subunit